MTVKMGDVAEALLDVIELLNPDDEQLNDMSTKERLEHRAAIGDLLATLPRSVVGQAMVKRGDWPWGEEKPVGVEAQCLKCDETFVPHAPEDVIHAKRADGQDCGGLGVIVETWR